ncbi:hypothetical protein SAMN05216242_10192 [Thauera chlorobenzoica]|uniref:Uncharacterized protein n=1 Tax=Thauera chlorobenzoica TaxID=96773 RepID=A0A1H5RPE0_9RHOO|nr:hypothetical protein Tchl_2374 [Thauera chlorobenzoica]SEF40233.1 hypothetical protein SAMN05216242_10192 [Thauera chlorobenzoica]
MAGPVIITGRGRPTHVRLSFEACRALLPPYPFAKIPLFCL